MATPVEPITARDAFAVTKSDSTVFTRIPSAIFVGGTGDVTVKTEAGNTVTFIGVPAGVTLTVRVTQVLSTGTSATNMVAYVY
jgi:hypothetical protein